MPTDANGNVVFEATGHNVALFQWGPLQFQVWPLNIHEIDHITETDWARKEIAGAATYREWVGENDETLHLQGRLFPYFRPGTMSGARGVMNSQAAGGGFANIEVMDAMRRHGISCPMVRGTGDVLGWFACERLRRGHQHLSIEGIGKVINFDAIFQRIPIPEADEFFPSMWAVGL